MLNTQKLLYVLPDLAYIAELLPDKKPHTFAIQSFKQINGEFLNETEFIAENVVKLVNKLEEGEEYFLILPDFLFTNTIVSVKETSDAKIKEKLASDMLPKLGLKEDTHLIETVNLNKLKGTTRVQLSAIEKSILSIFKVAIAEKDIKIAGVCPLSWAVKSLISLEPSISVLQMGSNLFTAQQYIGVDQTTTTTIESTNNIIETIKTLKGAESSIQTVYLCTNAIIEDKLKDELSKILPLQQMASKDAGAKIPSYISEIITASMRTLNISDYSVPTFKLTKATAEEKKQYANVLTAAPVDAASEDDSMDTDTLPKPKTIPGAEKEEETAPTEAETDTSKEEVEADSTDDTETKGSESAPEIDDIKEPAPAEKELPDIESVDKDAEDSTSAGSSDAAGAVTAAAEATALGAGVVTGAAATAATPAPVIAAPEEDTSIDDTSTEEASSTEVEATEPADTTTEISTETKVDEAAAEDTASTETPANEVTSTEETSVTSDTTDSTAAVVEPGSSDATISPEATTEVAGAADESSDQDIDLSQFTQNGKTAVQPKTEEKPVIKNKSGVKHMMKMILITTGVFILTVAIGIGVGLAILKYTGSNKTPETPVVEVEEPTPTPEATPEPTPEASASAEIDKSSLKILVVNATTKAGYAGQIATKLKSDDFSNVTGANAKGDYSEEGNFVYLKESNSALVDQLTKASGLTLTEDDSAKTEDASGQYDAVIVLAE